MPVKWNNFKASVRAKLERTLRKFGESHEKSEPLSNVTAVEYQANYEYIKVNIYFMFNLHHINVIFPP